MTIITQRFSDKPDVALKRTFQWIGRVLSARHRGVRLNQAPDWIDPSVIESIAITLGNHPPKVGGWELTLSVSGGIPLRTLPREVSVGQRHPNLPLRCVRAPLALAHSIPQVVRESPPLDRGAATCLVRDRLNPDRSYVVTCGHVVAPTTAARFADPLSILTENTCLSACLCEWQPSVGFGVCPSSIDAALVEIDSASALILREDAGEWLPACIDDDVWRDRPVSLLRLDGAMSATLKVHWSGRVCIPDGDDYPDYFLQDAVGYMTLDETKPGDSGAPIWTEDDALLGMHIGAIGPDGAYGANAVLGRISPVLDWYCVKPYTRVDPATLDAADWPGVRPRLAFPPADMQLSPSANDVVVMAKTIWGEARGEGEDGMRAVACVIRNRLLRKYRNCESVNEVCLDPWQFSCWNARDPNRRRLDRIDREPDAFYIQAYAIAEQTLAGRIVDSTQGALHYVASTLRDRPVWLVGKQPCKIIGGHEFYNDVA